MQRSVKFGAVFLPTTLLLLYVYMYSPHGAFGASDPLRANSSSPGRTAAPHGAFGASDPLRANSSSPGRTAAPRGAFGTSDPLGAKSSHVLHVVAGEEVAAHVRDLYGNGGSGPGSPPATAMRCHRCALVTSSGHVSGSGAGEEIDRTECVIRMNDAPTAGYERDVGTRTTLRVVGHSSVRLVARNSAELLADERPGGSPVIVVFWGLPDKIEDGWIQSFCGGERSNCFRISQDTERSKFNVLYRKETGLDRVGSETWLSTGFFTMVIATESCDHIKVYGAVPPDHCETRRGAQRTPYHYYDPRGPDECGFYLQHRAGMRGGSHRFITEKQVFGRWAKLYNITFTHPTW